MATVIAADDLNRYEVVQVRNTGNQTLGVNASPITPLGTVSTTVDAFGRQRISAPLTLFDSSHRYRDNELFETAVASAGAATFNASEGLIDLTVTTTSGSKVVRETTKVFSYQPGKSLLVLTTFVFNPSKTNLRQRVGYYGVENGLYFQVIGTGVESASFVERSFVTGAVTETGVTQPNWNVDKMDGTGPSGFTLDITKAQIFWMDIEWLGLGTVRLGFVIDGQFVHCHSFHHANLITSTYITTASLPVRYEIENIGTTVSNSVLKQICSTVISEGGYELRGLQQAIGTAITAPRVLTTAGTAYPVISIKLKAANLDAIVILTALAMLGTSNTQYLWRIVASAVTTGGTWFSAGANSSVEYNLTGTATSGGRVLAQGYFSSTNQNSSGIDILKEALFKFQLERNGLTSEPYELTLTVTAAADAANVHASMDWEEISR